MPITGRLRKPNPEVDAIAQNIQGMHTLDGSNGPFAKFLQKSFATGHDKAGSTQALAEINAALDKLAQPGEHYRVSGLSPQNEGINDPNKIRFSLLNIAAPYRQPPPPEPDPKTGFVKPEESAKYKQDLAESVQKYQKYSAGLGYADVDLAAGTGPENLRTAAELANRIYASGTFTNPNSGPDRYKEKDNINRLFISDHSSDRNAFVAEINRLLDGMPRDLQHPLRQIKVMNGQISILTNPRDINGRTVFDSISPEFISLPR